MSFLTPEYLASFDGLMLMTNGNLPFTAAQKQSIVEFVRNGKALDRRALRDADHVRLPGVRRGARRLLSAFARCRPPRSQAARSACSRWRIRRIRPRGCSVRRWPLNEEFYEFGRTVWDASRPTENVSQVGRLPILLPFSRDRVHVLLSLDTDRTDLSDLPNVPKGDYPQAWTRTFGAAAPSTRRSAIATTSGPTTRCSARTSPAASAGRSASRTDAMTCLPALAGAGLVAASWLAAATAGAQGPPPLPAPEFHHLHLNSVNPEAAIDFYTRQFPSTSSDTFAGQPALEIADRRLDPVHQGRHAAADRAADGVLALRLARHRRPSERSSASGSRA